ncbi:MAG TPA: polyphenol oxidase family protein [Longimicrobiales bacterium]|nr:polyphenol oxidase family protein [Longimicrobiales bacterium]
MVASAEARVVHERRATGDVPLFVHEEWRERFPWALVGITGAGDDAAFDLGLFGEAPAGAVTARWRALLARTGFPGAVHSRQAHESLVQIHEAVHEGLLVTEGFDAHATTQSGLLLTVSVADCVPIFLLDPPTGAVALLHAGWRGVAAGVLEAGLAALERLAGSGAERLWLHAGPAICGRCYEVGPEVHEALGLPRPAGNETVDLRATLVTRAVQAGLDADRVSVSGHCTRCGPGAFFSHRGGERGRQMAVLGIRPDGHGGTNAAGTGRVD